MFSYVNPIYSSPFHNVPLLPDDFNAVPLFSYRDVCRLTHSASGWMPPDTPLWFWHAFGCHCCPCFFVLKQWYEYNKWETEDLSTYFASIIGRTDVSKVRAFTTCHWDAVWICTKQAVSLQLKMHWVTMMLFFVSASSQMRRPFVSHFTAMLNVYEEKGGCIWNGSQAGNKGGADIQFYPSIKP